MRALQSIVAVRNVQRLAAEMAVSEARADLRSREAEQERRDQVLQESQKRWAATLSEPAFSLSLTSVWSSAVLHQQVELDTSREAVREGEAVCEAKSREWWSAQARLDVAEELTLAARRRLSRLREEAAMESLADRTSQRAISR